MMLVVDGMHENPPSWNTCILTITSRYYVRVSATLHVESTPIHDIQGDSVKYACDCPRDEWMNEYSP